MKHKVTLSVLRGGAFARVPQVLAVDMGEDGFSPAESKALARARERGLHLVVFAPPELVRAHQAVEVVKGCATLVSDGSLGSGTSPLSRRAARAEALAQAVQEQGVDFGPVIVVATSPVDRDALMLAGVAFALEDAGYDGVAAADHVFPARAAGGFVQAIDAACALVAKAHEARYAPGERTFGDTRP